MDCLDSYADIVVSESNIQWAIDHVEKLKFNERIISAANLVDKIDAYFDTNSLSSSSWTKLKSRNATLVSRRNLAVKSIAEFNNDKDDEWTFVQQVLGIRTHYKPENDGTIWVKLSGKSRDINILDCISVLREVDLFNLWFPFCRHSDLVSHVSRVELLAHLSVTVPLITRDAVIHAYAIDATREYGSVLVLGNSVDSFPGVDIPPVEKRGLNTDRLVINGFKGIIKPISRTSAFVTIVTNVDPKCPLPQSLINLSTRKLAGMILYYLLKEAEKIGKDSENPYARRMDEDPTGFYKWMTPRMESYFIKLENGTLPPLLDTETSAGILDEKVIVVENDHQPKRRKDLVFWPLLPPLMLLLSNFWVAVFLKLGISSSIWYFGITEILDPKQYLPLRKSGLKFVISVCITSTAIVWAFLHDNKALWLFLTSLAYSIAMTLLISINRKVII